MAEGDLWFFDRVAPIYHRLMPPVDRSSLHTGVAQADLEVTRVIDLGGGTGRSAMAVRKWDPVVIDASRSMLEQVGTGLTTIQASATRLPLGTETVDVVTIVDAFHHFPAQSTVLAEVVRVLRPKGVVIIRDFDPTSRRGRLVAAVEHLFRMRSRFVTVTDLKAELEAVGMEPMVLASGFVYTVVGRKSGSQ